MVKAAGLHLNLFSALMVIPPSVSFYAQGEVFVQ
jgi:hypothetical protein